MHSKATNQLIYKHKITQDGVQVTTLAYKHSKHLKEEEKMVTKIDVANLFLQNMRWSSHHASLIVMHQIGWSFKLQRHSPPRHYFPLSLGGHILYAPEKRERSLYCKIFLESDEKLQQNCFPSSYKGGRMLNLESSLCLRLGSSSGGGE